MNLAAAQKLVAPYTGRTSAFPVTQPLVKHPPAGTKYALLQSATPVCALFAQLFEGATKWLRNDPRVLLLDEPTQGVDVGAKASIYALIAAAAADGAAVLVASCDMKELAFLCDRVLVMRDGRVAATLDGPALSEANLVSASLGLRQSEVAALFGGLPDNPPDSTVRSPPAEVENA